MSKRTKYFLVILTVFAILVVPLLGALIYYKGEFPSHLFYFPPTEVTAKPGFSGPVFIGLLFPIAFVVLLYIYPWWFGFKRPENRQATNSEGKFPWWFWAGLVVSSVDAVFLFGHIESATYILNLGFIPIIWGIVFATDGWVYKRTNGHSILGDKPWNLVWMACCSAFAWGYFEYLSFYVGVNWYYPEAARISTLAFYVYAIVGGGVLVPFAFEGYMLLNSFKALGRRYSFGPKITLSKPVQTGAMVISLLSIFLITYFPNILFPMVWLGPVIILSVAFDMIGLWTPFRPIAREGNWTPLALIGFAELIIGLIHETVNFFSAFHHPFSTIVPGYWIYSVPYVDRFYVFEMPFEGLFGYLPYGIYNWIIWIGFAYIFKISTQFNNNKAVVAGHLN
ncbi:MAG: hypothetical protein JEZ14_04950 [Marinilabiliaceae bacterium]|nr:hypothetical protein [Marinilabiliaceae bacterium]